MTMPTRTAPDPSSLRPDEGLGRGTDGDRTCVRRARGRVRSPVGFEPRVRLLGGLQALLFGLTGGATAACGSGSARPEQCGPWAGFGLNMRPNPAQVVAGAYQRT